MKKDRGFTLIELFVTLAISAIVLTFAVPGFRNLMQDTQATTQINTLLSAFKQARSEAITRGTTITVCPSNDGSNCLNNQNNWNKGWIITDGSNVLQVGDEMEDTTVGTGAPNSVTYKATGTLQGLPGKPLHSNWAPAPHPSCAA